MARCDHAGNDRSLEVGGEDSSLHFTFSVKRPFGLIYLPIEAGILKRWAYMDFPAFSEIHSGDMARDASSNEPCRWLSSGTP